MTVRLLCYRKKRVVEEEEECFQEVPLDFQAKEEELLPLVDPLLLLEDLELLLPMVVPQADLVLLQE